MIYHSYEIDGYDNNVMKYQIYEKQHDKIYTKYQISSVK